MRRIKNYNYEIAKEFARTPRQKQVIDLMGQHRDVNKSAEILNVHPRKIYTHVQNVAKNAALQGVSIDPVVPDSPATPGRSINAVTRQLDGDGNLTQQWVKEKADDIFKQTIVEVLEEKEIWKPLDYAAPLSSLNANVDQMKLYTIADLHLGCFALKDQHAGNYNVEIARSLGQQAIEHLATPASHGVLNLLGDFLHWDGLESVTPRSKHVLDAEGSYHRVVNCAIDLVMDMIHHLLQYHKTLEIIVSEGNHDESGSVWLQGFIRKFWENEPRVIVTQENMLYHAHIYGDNFLGYHHGHKKKPVDLCDYFAANQPFRSMWGQAEHAYIHTGHLHNATKLLSKNGATIVQHHTLATPDEYTKRGGWSSKRGATSTTYHKKYGEIGTNTVCPEMFSI